MREEVRALCETAWLFDARILIYPALFAVRGEKQVIARATW